MSDVYVQEPAATGKVIFNTSYGELEVELWCKESPMACRNFIQLALEGYYDETPFHRLIPRFILQGGDPKGTGACESVYEGAFKVETHSRISFSRRGILGFAAASPGLVSSQFFFTLDAAPELDKSNTAFGRIVGDTVYNLLRMGELEVEPGTEKPLFPPVVNSLQVLLNPFAEDMVLRELPEVQERLLKARPVPKAKPTAARISNKCLLSFAADDDEEEEDVLQQTKVLSSHDVLNDPKLSKNKLDLTSEPISKAKVTSKPVTSGPSEYELLKMKEKDQLTSVKASIAAVQQDLKHGQQIVIEQKEESTKKRKAPKQSSYLDKMRAAYKSKPNAIMGKRRKDAVEDVNTLLTLNAFKEKLHSIGPPEDTQRNLDPTKLTSAVAPEPAKVLEICKLHGLVGCLSCKNTFGLKEDIGGEEGWLMHRLVFDKELGYRQVREELTNLVVIDPREKAKELEAKHR